MLRARLGINFTPFLHSSQRPAHLLAARKFPAMSGTLNMRVIEAKDLKSHTTFSTMDPFVKIAINNQPIAKTKTHNNGGKKPQWNQKMSPVQLNSVQGSTMTLSLFGKFCLSSLAIILT
jgi:hypothetical protein